MTEMLWKVALNTINHQTNTQIKMYIDYRNIAVHHYNFGLVQNVWHYFGPLYAITMKTRFKLKSLH